MSEWGYSKKKGQGYRKRPRKGVRYEDVADSLRNNGTRIHQPTEKEYLDFARSRMQRSQDHDNNIWAEKIKNNILPQNKEIFEHAVILLKPAIPFIASVDPTMATIYGAYRFGKFGYDFASKVNQEAKVYGSYERALWKVTEKTVDEKIISKLKSLPIKNGSEFAGKGLWAYYKAQNPEVKISETLDKHAENALIHTFKEIGDAVI